MTRFKKAKPLQARLKVSIYGPPGSGKTFTTLLMAEGLAAARGKRIAYLDTERGTDFYAMKIAARKVHPEAFDFDALYTRSLAEVTEAIKALNPEEHGVIVLDSISHLWDAAMDAYAGGKTKIDSIPMHAWGKIKKPYKDLIAWLIGSPFDVFILGRQKNIFDKDDDGEMTKTGVGMRAEGETAYEPHLCLRMETEFKKDDPTKTTSRQLCFVEKDRTGILMGQIYKNPGFSMVEPLLPLLGDIQAPVEDSDERAARDSELMGAIDDAKAKAKEEKSLGLFRDFSSKLSSADSLPILADVTAELKKQKRYLTEDHAKSLGELLIGAREKLTTAVTL